MSSLASKLTLAFLVVGLTGALLVAAILHQRTRAAFNEFILNQEQEALVNYLVEYYQANGSWDGVVDRLHALLTTFPRPVDGGRSNQRERPPFILVGPDQRIVFSNIPGQVGQRVPDRQLRGAVPLDVGGEPAGWLLPSPVSRQWIPNSPEGLFLRNINRAALLSALVASALALTLGGLLAFTLTRPLRELTEVTVEIARGRPGRQVKVRSKDELGDLAAAFNRMSQDLARATQARRQMTADIAHDLRSPLSVISGYAEALSDGKLDGTPEVYTILNQETRHVSRLVDDLRTLSLADSGELPLNRQPVHPQALLERVAARQAVAALDKGITLRVETGQDLPVVDVDPERMAQVFDNLITNAFRYTPSGGSVVLAARVVNGSVQMQVRDTGSGIAPEDAPHIFDRFYRGDKSRRHTGESGLGLAIARSIVAAHGGTISVASAPGQGATFTISLEAKPTG